MLSFGRAIGTQPDPESHLDNRLLKRKPVMCCEAVGWATGRASGMEKLGVGLLVVRL